MFPKNEANLEKIFEYFHGIDLIFHAGDITYQKVSDVLFSIAPVTAVKENNDKIDFNPIGSISVHNFKIVLNHGTDFSRNFDKLYEFGKSYGADILITSHTHKIHNEILRAWC